MAKTRLQYRTGILTAANMASGEVDSTELNEIVQDKCDALYDKLVLAFDDYNITTSAELTPSAGTDYVSLPADFKHLRAVDRKMTDGVTFSDLPRFELSERNDLLDTRYTVFGDRLMIRPANVAPTTTVRLYYTPKNYAFVDDVTAGFDDRGFFEWVYLAGAIKLKMMAEKDASDLERQLAAMDAAIEVIRARRDSANPKKMIDKRKGNFYYSRRGFGYEDI